MRIIGLTGSIACGKSTVSSYLVSRGFPVVDGDRISRELTASDGPVLQDIYRNFGPDVFYEDGSLNRRCLGRLVFSNSDARKALDDIMAPYLLAATRQQIDIFAAQGDSLCFLDMPLLFEKGYESLCDSVWTVWLPEDVQISRLMMRDALTRDEALLRIHSALSSDEKAALADKVIDNSGTIAHTRTIVSAMLDQELEEARQNRLSRVQGFSDRRTDSSSQINESRIAPQVMERPDAAKKSRPVRKSSWRVPFWLKTSIIVLTCILLISATSQILMSAYLRRRTDLHIAEQAEINRRYPILYRDLIERYASEYNLSPAFVAAVIRNESSFDPKAESGVGARGLMQLMPDTAEWIAGKLQISGYAFERMYDPESNIQFGCWYLNYLSRLFMGDPVSVAAAYHAGQGQVKTWLSDPLLSEDGYTMPIESLPEGPTKNYTGRVLRDYGIYLEKYFSQAQSPVDSDTALTGFSSVLRGNR